MCHMQCTKQLLFYLVKRKKQMQIEIYRVIKRKKTVRLTITSRFAENLFI